MYNYNEVLESSLEYFNGDELASKVFTDKYALRDNDGNFLEKTPKDMHKRLAKEFSRIEKNKFKNPLTESDIFSYLENFKYIIPQGSPMFGIGNNYQYVSNSNCFVLTTPEDSYGGILATDEQIIQVSKRRGGVGVDISKIRPKGSITNNASRTSTGIVPFMERYSNSINEVGQSGRRGALMLTVSVHHPDIMDFVKVKSDSKKVTGANISVKLTNEFLNAVKENKEYEIRFPVNSRENGEEPKIKKMVSATEIWDEICKNAHSMAEPGILFWDNIIENSPADSYKTLGFESVSTNPCVVGDTLVLTNIGWSKIKNLENLKKENPKLTIVTRDKDNNLTNSELTWVGITHKDSQIVRVSFDNKELLLTTPEHKLYMEDYSEKMVKDMIPGDIVIGGNGLLSVVSIKNIVLKEDVWDLTAKPNYNFFSLFSYEEKINTEDIVVNDDITFKSYDVVQTETVTKFAYELNDNPYIDSYFQKSILSVDCGEIPLCELDSCRLSLLNSYSYVNFPFTENAEFDFEKFFNHIVIAQRLMDDIIDLEEESLNKIISKIKQDPENIDIKQREIDLWEGMKLKAIQGRRTGLGLTAVGDTIAALNMGYSTDESIEFINDLYKTLKYGSYYSSVEMAKEIGAFPIFDYELEKDNKFLLRIKNEFPTLYNDMKKYGRRNIACNTTAPAGSVSILTQTTSGIEPLFMMSYTRRKKINDGDVSEDKVDFIDELGIKWQEFKVYHPKLKEWMNITGETDENKSPWSGYCAEELDWKQRVKLQSNAQNHIDHSISSCLTPDALIKTNKGLFYLDELVDFNTIKENIFLENTKNKSKVLNHNGTYVDINSFYNNGIKQIYKLKLTNGLALKSTYNERVFVLNEETGLDEWIYVKDINIGDKIKLK